MAIGSILFWGGLAFAYYYLVVRSVLFANKKFKCQHCGRCCRFIVWLNDKDIKRIKTGTDYVGSILGQKFIKPKKLKCRFLKFKNGKSHCSIYNTRPGVCRRYPSRTILGFKAKDARCKGLMK